MTDQIERELETLFSERAERLDVLPPLPAARVRRARLHVALAMASVVAVLAAVGTAGVRLASGGGDGVSFAGSGSAQDQLQRISQRMLLGRWRLTGTERITTGTASGGGQSEVTEQVDYDGPRKAAIARIGGQVTAIMVDGVAYAPLANPPDVAAYLPKNARWQRVTRSPFGSAGPAAAATQVVGSGFSASIVLGMSFGRPATGAMDHSVVRRTSTGFQITSDDGFGSTRTVVTLRDDGSIASAYSVTHVQMPSFAPGAVPARKQTIVLDARFTRLSAPVRVAAPDPATVVTDAQFQAAFQKATANGAPGSRPCPSSMARPSPAVTTHRVFPGGSVTTTQSETTLSCRIVVLTPVASPPSSTSPR